MREAVRESLEGMRRQSAEAIKTLEADLMGDKKIAVGSILSTLVQHRTLVTEIDRHLAALSPEGFNRSLASASSVVVEDLEPGKKLSDDGRHIEMLTTVANAAKNRVKHALRCIVEGWVARAEDERQNKFDALHTLRTSFGGLDTPELDKAVTELQDEIIGRSVDGGVPKVVVALCGSCKGNVRYDTIAGDGRIRLAVFQRRIVGILVLPDSVGDQPPVHETRVEDATCQGCAFERVAKDMMQGRKLDEEWNGPKS